VKNLVKLKKNPEKGTTVRRVGEDREDAERTGHDPIKEKRERERNAKEGAAWLERNRTKIIAGLVLVALIAAGACYWFLFYPRGGGGTLPPENIPPGMVAFHLTSSFTYLESTAGITLHSVHLELP